jgi:hypothetical protein
MTDRGITTWIKHAPLARTLGKYLHQIVGYVVRCSWSHVDRCRPNSVVGQMTVFTKIRVTNGGLGSQCSRIKDGLIST